MTEALSRAVTGLVGGVLVVGGAACADTGAAGGAGQDGSPFDAVIMNGRIVDGTGNPWYSADAGIRDGKVAEIGWIDPDGAEGATVIDASGKVVAPGFIDIHAHSETRLVVDGSATSKITQGVTTEVQGERASVVPLEGEGDQRRVGGTRGAEGGQSSSPSGRD